MKTISYKSSYKVGTEQIHFVISIGEGQFGTSLVIVDGTFFEQERRFDHDLGLGSALVGKKIRASSVVTDIVAQSNRTSVTYQLTGGANGPTEHVSELTVDNDNESVLYVAEIELVQ